MPKMLGLGPAGCHGQCLAYANWFDYNLFMPARKPADPVKETNRLIRLARSYWDAHKNHACRIHRDKAMAMYDSLTPEQREQVPQVLRVWLRYRSEKYFGPRRTPPGAKKRKDRGG